MQPHSFPVEHGDPEGRESGGGSAGEWASRLMLPTDGTSPASAGLPQTMKLLGHSKSEQTDLQMERLARSL